MDDLRPPALDELGLASALRGASGRCLPRHRRGRSRQRHPAALEVAAYRIATEALANIARHTHASHVRVNVSVDDRPLALRVEVIDDGPGLPTDMRPGVGLRSMRERADEVGGTCEISTVHDGGTMVRAGLPIPQLDEWGGHA